QSKRKILQAHCQRKKTVGTAPTALGQGLICHHECFGGRMTLLHRIASVVRFVLRRKKDEQLLDDEIRAYIDLSASAKLNDGVPPLEARRLVLGWLLERRARVSSRWCSKARLDWCLLESQWDCLPHGLDRDGFSRCYSV